MKKFFYFSFAMAFLTLASCSAPEPGNGLPIDQPIYEGDNQEEKPNPLPNYRLSAIFGDNYSGTTVNSSISYRVSDTPETITIQRVNESAEDYLRQTISRTLKFGYTLEGNLPESIAITSTKTIEGSEFSNPLTSVINVTDMQFSEAGLLQSLNYTEDGAELVHTVSLGYDDDNHLILITVDETEEFIQEWNADGDLTRISSPFYGESVLTYSTVENKYGQWDPELPLFGVLQQFGWIGKAPAHFPGTINTAAPVYGNPGGTSPKLYALDYYVSLNYYGLFNKVKASSGLEDSFTLELNFINK